MNRAQLEHILRASAAITGARQLVVIGSQAILGQFPDAPAELLVSMEADVLSLESPEAADLIDGSIGEGSPFDETFGYFAHGVSIGVATLPGGWRERLVPVNTPATGGAIGLCLEVHDLAVSRLVAGRERDINFVAALLRHGLAKPQVVAERLALTKLTDEVRLRCEARLQHLYSKNSPA